MTSATPRYSRRKDEILLRVLAQRVVKIKDLAEEFAVSEMTIRREIDWLAEQGQIERMHGGARIRQVANEELSYGFRAEVNADAKSRIAGRALSLVQDGDTVGLDASTTALALARVLPSKKVHAILTGLDAIDAFNHSGLDLYVCGGFYHAKARSFVGTGAIAALERLNPDKVFFSCHGYTVESGFMDPNPQEADTKRALIRSGAMKIALVDASKFGKRALATTARTEEVDLLVTDQELSLEYRTHFERCGVEVIVAPPVIQAYN
ncbi:MAG: DeoR/GlpR family DNA-binding transcription regulator [Armatimonadota bacterium]|jgi:DeoR family fructose operon transcriptional repressor